MRRDPRSQLSLPRDEGDVSVVVRQPCVHDHVPHPEAVQLVSKARQLAVRGLIQREVSTARRRGAPSPWR